MLNIVDTKRNIEEHRRTTRKTTGTATPSRFSTLLMWFHVSPTLRWSTMAAIGVVTSLLPRASQTCAAGPAKAVRHENRIVQLTLLGLEGMP